jgi:hypothetical protein
MEGRGGGDAQGDADPKKGQLGYFMYDHLVRFALIWYIFPFFGIMYQEKSGNPARNPISNSSEYKLS